MVAANIKQNYLSPIEFRFLIKRLPYTEFFTQSANVPGLSISAIERATPFKTLYFSGDNVTFNEFTVNVRVDENMNNYQEIFNWIVGLSFPDNFDQYANLSAGDGIYSDATLMIMTSGKNPNIQIVYKDIFPTSLGDIQLNTTSGDVDYATCDITFKIGSYEIRPV